MALSRRTGARFQSSIWPGFVDAMTGLLLVLMFVLTIFMVVQFVLTERISGQEDQLDTLSGEVAALAEALGLEQSSSAQLEEQLGALSTSLDAARNQAEAQAARIAALTQERDTNAAELAETQTELTGAQSQITRFEAQVAGLLSQRDSAQAQLVDLQAQNDALQGEKVALLSDNETLRNDNTTLQSDNTNLQSNNTALLSEKEALDLALAATRSEVNAAEEAARLAAARREALDALIADLRARNGELTGQVTDLSGQVADAQQALTDEEAGRLTQSAAVEALRARLEAADTELTSMTLALENQRKAAEDTLTMLAAARSVETDLNTQLAVALMRLEDADEAIQTGTQTEQELREARNALALLRAELDSKATTEAGLTQERADLQAQLAQALASKLAAEALINDQSTAGQKQAALLAAAQDALSQERATSSRAQRQTELLNQQVAALRGQLGELQALLDEAKTRDAAKNVQLQSLGSELNTALARVAAEQSRRAQLEAEERKRLEAETKNLEQYRSEFFGRLRGVLGNQDGVRIEGDRFVFSSEVLFPPGGAVLSDDGRGEIAKVAEILKSVADDIPPEIDWIIRVDGHTDDVPLSGTGVFVDNWELSQGRALSVVKYMIGSLGIPPARLAANGFGQYQPVAFGDSDEARAQNRRIELKFTEK